MPLAAQTRADLFKGLCALLDIYLARAVAPWSQAARRLNHDDEQPRPSGRELLERAEARGLLTGPLDGRWGLQRFPGPAPLLQVFDDRALDCLRADRGPSAHHARVMASLGDGGMASLHNLLFESASRFRFSQRGMIWLSDADVGSLILKEMVRKISNKGGVFAPLESSSV